MDFTKSQDSNIDTITPLTRPSSLTNGASHRHNPPPPPAVVSYKECLKNHAASRGGVTYDGCGEFSPAPSATPVDPTSFKCTACGCHRNFHRREPQSPSPSSCSPAASPAPMLVALSAAAVDGRKRARTKFTAEQKERMYAFAEKLGWKMARASDEKMVADFCGEIGVKRNVFKVWMHNNKRRIKDKENGNVKNKIEDCNGNVEEDEVASSP